ncbi:MAG: hypothetical protein EP326_09540 [Deltaproteobacteria bacterium]|nr:MAG: hypothetical protein EP326_09540 [Deltaproteobacteria bacterium]TNF27679.1 MAG: hypothetical protein EP319_10995 [Deltaproteobacteria bacterium]
MKQTYFNDSSSQKEALINEFKGNLFEYLLGHSMARKRGIESRFIQSFGGELRSRLSEYESWLRVHDQELIYALPTLAEACSAKLDQLLGDTKIQNILVMGKIGSAGGNDHFKEADLLILSEDEKVIPVSLKLCKAHSFVNTKSAGVKSFIEKYFTPFRRALEFQTELNQRVELSFLSMAKTLHDMAGLNYQNGFDQRWKDAGLPELPGQLEKEMNAVVVESYRPVIAKIREILLIFHKEDPVLFQRCLRPLLGFGKQGLVQLTCYHQVKDGKKYQLYSIDMSSGENLENDMTDCIFEQENPDISSFQINCGEVSLQIRVKPMNKFTSMAHKINCSIKNH